MELPIKESMIYYFEESVRKNANEIAVTDKKGSYTYRQLQVSSECVAAYLQTKLEGNNQIVAILMDRTKESIVAMLGILKLGYTYMFIDKNYPMERIKYMIIDAEVNLVITDDMEIIYRKEINNIVHFDVASKYNKYNSTQFPIFDLKTGAYIIYTSGSSGKPKGLEINHFNFIRLYQVWVKNNFESMDKKSLRTAVIAPFVFDMSVLMIFFSLFKGYHLYIISDEEKQNGMDIINFLTKNKIDFMDATPNYLRLMDNYLTLNEGAEFSLLRIFCIGDVLGYKLVKNIIDHAKNPQFQLYNTYGPAECTIFVTFYVLDKKNIDSISKVFIGKATDNTFLEIVDEDFNECQDGQVGELIIFGDSVGNGYISKIETTQNPFKELNRRLGILSYRTGDLVRLDESGNYEFIGRKDRQCKINGYRVELEEIEHTIENILGIREAKILVQKDEFNFVKIYGFYCGEREYRSNEIRRKLKKELPYYMLPQEIMYCDKFPVTHNGKINYTVLLRRIDEKSNENEIGAYTYDKICELLDAVEIDTTKSFFEIDGNSITLLALVSSINNKFNVNVDISKLYLADNIDELIVYVRELKIEKAVCIIANTFEKGIPIIESQKKLLNQEMKMIKSGATKEQLQGFTLLYKLTFTQEIQKQKLQDAIYAVMKQNEVFYIQFEKTKSRYFMKLRKNINPIEIKSKKKDQDILSIITNFKISGGEHIEFFLENGQVSTLYIHIKHILLDFISVQYIIDDILKEYYNVQHRFKRNGFLSYLEKQDSIDETITIEYWKQKMKDKPIRTSLIADTCGKSEFDVKNIVCDEIIYNKLKLVASEQKTSIFMVLITIFMKNISNYNNEETLMIGCYFPGRNYKYDNGILGMLTNVLPFITTLGNKEQATLIKKVECEILELMHHQYIRLSNIYQMVPMEHMADGELFDITFNYQNEWISLADKNNHLASIETINVDPDITNGNFYFGVVEENSFMRWEIKYNKGNYSSKFIQDFVKDLNTLILKWSTM